MECNYFRLEKDLLKSAFADRVPLMGAMAITHRCNLNCAHCYANPVRDIGELSYTEICKIIDKIVDAGCLFLLITGGEPLIRSDFLDIYKYAKKRGLLITIATNATLINDKIIKCLNRFHPYKIGITLYGFSEGTYQKVTNKKNMFKECLDNILLVHKNNLPLELKTFLLKDNAKDVEKMQNFAKDLGLTLKINQNIVPMLNGSKKSLSVALSPKELVAFNFNNKEIKDAIIKNFKEKIPTNKDNLFLCSAGKSSFYINPLGHLQICNVFQYPKYNLLNGSFEEGWSIIKKIIMKKRPKRNKCRECKLIGFCRPCPGVSLLESKQLNDPYSYRCEQIKLTYDKIKNLLITQK